MFSVLFIKLGILSSPKLAQVARARSSNNFISRNASSGRGEGTVRGLGGTEGEGEAVSAEEGTGGEDENEAEAAGVPYCQQYSRK